MKKIIYTLTFAITLSSIVYGAGAKILSVDEALKLYPQDSVQMADIKAIIKKGINIPQKQSGSTALMIATYYGYNELVKSLIASGAEVNIKDKYGETALSQAIYTNNLELAKLLVKARADITSYNKDGRSPLMIACERGSVDIIKFLIKSGADVNDDSGTTPLIVATKNGRFDVIQLLINAHANVNAENTNGESALSLAKDNETKTLLINAGAK